MNKHLLTTIQLLSFVFLSTFGLISVSAFMDSANDLGWGLLWFFPALIIMGPAVDYWREESKKWFIKRR